MTNHTTTMGAASRRRRGADARAARVAAIGAAMLRDHDATAADDAAGAGWSVVALYRDGTAEILATMPTAGDAAEIAAAHHAARHADGAHDAPRAVIVPTYSAADMIGAR